VSVILSSGVSGFRFKVSGCCFQVSVGRRYVAVCGVKAGRKKRPLFPEDEIDAYVHASLLFNMGLSFKERVKQKILHPHLGRRTASAVPPEL
jgi:hypothetical protein